MRLSGLGTPGAWILFSDEAGSGSSCSCAGGLCGVHGPWASGAPVTRVLEVVQASLHAGDRLPDRLWIAPREGECLPRENIFAAWWRARDQGPEACCWGCNSYSATRSDTSSATLAADHRVLQHVGGQRDRYHGDRWHGTGRQGYPGRR